jgi:glycosyltransferase involved in cell wall biosynthesis
VTGTGVLGPSGPASGAEAAPAPAPAPPASSARTLVILPALNEEAALAAVLKELAVTCPQLDVLVVDDGSTDATASRATAAGALVMRLPFNLGVGGAMRAAYRWGRDRGYTQVIQVDADGQHDAAELATLLEVQAADPSVDIVIGSRFAGKGDYAVRGPRRWAMRMLSVGMTMIVGTDVKDPTSGFRLVNRRALNLFAEHYPEEYLGDTVEALVMAHRTGLTMRQVPVVMRVRETGTASTNPFRSAVYLVRVIVAIGLAMVRRRPRAGES